MTAALVRHREGARHRPQNRARERIACILLSLIWLLFACAPEAPKHDGPFNLLLVSIDTLRADHLGAYGYPRDTSPHIDRLAREGVLFETMVAETSWTLPSHMSLLTGQSSLVHGAFGPNRALAPGIETLAELLAAAGYRTEGYGSAPFVHPIFGFGRGFERYAVLGETIYDAKDAELSDRPDDLPAQQRLWRADRQWRRARLGVEVGDRAIEAIERSDERPFFVFAHFFDPHYDYDPPERYWRPFDPDYAGEIDGVDFLSDPRFAPGMPKADFEHVLALYDGEIRYTDEQFGRILEKLDERGLASKTLVVVVSDHGEEFLEHGSRGHSVTLYDEQLLVPFVMRLEGSVPAGLRVKSQARSIDVVPTVLDILGLETRTTFSGRSMLPFVRGEGGPEEPAISYLWRNPGDWSATLRLPDRKVYLASTKKGASSQVFDLRADPGEQKGRPAQADEVATLRSALEASRERARTGVAPVELELSEEMREALKNLGYLQDEQQE